MRNAMVPPQSPAYKWVFKISSPTQAMMWGTADEASGDTTAVAIMLPTSNNPDA